MLATPLQHLTDFINTLNLCFTWTGKATLTFVFPLSVSASNKIRSTFNSLNFKAFSHNIVTEKKNIRKFPAVNSEKY